jgi:hypothetical protein
LSQAWRTVEAIEVINGDDEDAPRDQLADGVFAALQQVTAVPLEWADACASRRSLPWKKLETTGGLRSLEALTRRTAKLPSLENLWVSNDDEGEFAPAARVLFSAAWGHVRTRTISGDVDLSLTGDRVTVTLGGAPEASTLVSALQEVPRERVKTLLLQAAGVLKQGELVMNRRRIDLSPLATFARKRGLAVLFRQFSEVTHEPLPGQPVVLGAKHLERAD